MGSPRGTASDTSWLGTPIDVRPLFAPESASLLGLLRTLRPADWGKAAVPGWTVRDLAAHLLGDYRGRLGWATPGFRPAFGPGETLEAFIHRVNQEWVDLHADTDPATLVGALERTGAQVARQFEGADLDAMGLGVSWAGAMPTAPNWLDTAREFTEYWTHRQQIRHAVGRDTDTATRPLAAVLDTFLRALPHTLRDTPATAGTQVQVVIDGQSGGTWTATATPTATPTATEAARWSLAEAPAGPPTASVRLDPETAWRLCSRGIEPDAALAAAHLQGTPHLARAALHIVSIVR
ncbi:maleylpyruvate isomerase family mycothiol-dependent enzyme [Streptomyces sp. NBC_00448]|uniref:maleylpyruvate isomerase family mycothiol-dependent enzyme n=1 Tax=Streptomyces sp. NBC_00448 TaxID=2903652 RepID=UPI002E1D77BD